MLRRIESTSERLWMGRGSHGHTSQAVTAISMGAGVFMSVERIGGGLLAVQLDREERDALVAWLLARQQQQSILR